MGRKLSRSQLIGALRALNDDQLVGLLIDARQEDSLELSVNLMRQLSIRSGVKLSELLSRVENSEELVKEIAASAAKGFIRHLFRGG